MSTPTASFPVLEVSGATDVGLKRSNNEDAFGILHPKTPWRSLEAGAFDSGEGGAGLLIAVSDGMGGALAGEEASRLTLEFVARGLAPDPAIKPGTEAAVFLAAIQSAHRRLTETAAADSAKEGMGATFSGIWRTPGGEYWIGHVGDSRIYLWREDKLTLLTRDQTVVQGMIERGELTPDAAGKARFRHVLEQAIGGDGRPIDPQIEKIEVRASDVFLLCSDGLTDGCSERQLSQALARAASGNSLRTGVRGLVTLAKEESGSDNITAVLVRVNYRGANHG